MSLGN